MTIAIIGASVGQMRLCLAAREMGLKSICFSWPKGAICKDIVDVFYPISIIEKDRIVEICRQEHVEGVVTNASDLTVEIASYVTDKLNLNGNTLETIKCIKDKEWVRNVTNGILGLSPVEVTVYHKGFNPKFPCIVKPTRGSSKAGVSYADNQIDFFKAIEYSQSCYDGPILIEEYIPGHELSVETLSYRGEHFIIQYTDKRTSGPPHFVELEHHQPSSIDKSLKERFELIVPQLLDRVGFLNGPAHIEFKIDDSGNIYLIEVNPRGGGDHISDTLIRLSTGYDYIKGLIGIAIDSFEKPVIPVQKFSGIYYLCSQTKNILPYFRESYHSNWIYEKSYGGEELKLATGNTDRNGFLIYRGEEKLILT